MKIAILYICTGKYNQFFSGFYESSEKYFLKDQAQKHYFVFTDDMKVSNAENVTLIEKECKGFPLDSLFRFDMFLSIKDKLFDFDYIYFFNANMKFDAPVGSEIIPNNLNEGLVAVIHPGFFKRPSFLYPFERNRKSEAYIPPKLNNYQYYMGSLNGGESKAYLNLIEECSTNIWSDFNKGIIAIYHDESHLNKYLLNRKCLGLSPSYAYPEDSSLPFYPKIIIRDKVKIDKYFDKVRQRHFIGWIKKGWWYLYRTIIWYM